MFVQGGGDLTNAQDSVPSSGSGSEALQPSIQAPDSTLVDDVLSHPGHYPGVVKKPDKKVVIGEVISDQALVAFLTVRKCRHEPMDFTRLRVAYQSLPAEAFGLFLDLLVERELPLNPSNAQGCSFVSFLEKHPAQLVYAQLLRQRLDSA